MTTSDVEERSVHDRHADEPAAEGRPAHPPLRLRERRSILLPDLRPPTIEELRWRSQERRERKAAPPEPRRSRIAERTAQRRAARDLQLPPLPPLAPVEAALPVRIEPEVAVEATRQWPAELAQWVEPAAPFEQVEPLVAVPQRLEERPAEPAETEPLVEETDDLDGLDAELDLDLDFRPVPAMLREPRVASEPSRWRQEPVAVVASLPPPTPDIVAVFDEPGEDDPVVDAMASIELEPWRPDSVEPLESSADDEAPSYRFQSPSVRPPLVSQVLVVREPVPFEPARVAVLDAPAETITRLVPLPAEPIDEAVDESIHEVVVEPYPDERYDPPPAVPKEWHGRPAPLYWRLLRLRYVRPNGWLRALFFEGAVAVAVVLVLAEAASVWTIVVLPMVVAVIVKANDVVAGSLRRSSGVESNSGAAAPPH